MKIEKQTQTFGTKAEAEDYARALRERGWAASAKTNLPRAGFKVTARRPL